MSDEVLWFHIIADLRKNTSAEQMAEALARLAQMLNITKPEAFGSPVNNTK
jgi:hypothetical protein